MKILVIRLSSMGDVILVTPALSYLKSNYPDSEIVLITGSQYAELFTDDPRLTSIVPYSRSNGKEVFSGLASKKWDIVVDLQNNRRSKRLKKEYFQRARCGLFNKLHLKRFLLLFLRIDLYKKGSSVAERYMRATGFTSETEIDIPPVKLYFDKRETGKDIISSEPGYGDTKPVIALFPFSAWKNKKWVSSSYAEVGRHFLQKDWNVVIMGGPEDAGNAEKLKSDIGGNCISLVGKMSLYETGCFLKQCGLALGNDTGLSHLARACGVKTGIIYGATTHHFGFFPYGDPPFKVFQKREFCRPCHPYGGNWCWRLSRPCLRKIKESEVVEGLEKMIAHS